MNYCFIYACYCVGLVKSIRQPNKKVLILQKDYEKKLAEEPLSNESNEVSDLTSVDESDDVPYDTKVTEKVYYSR